jgi:hypothetical protein
MAQTIRSEKAREDRLPYLSLNMRYTLAAWNGEPADRWVQTARRIAQIVLFPILIFAACEALFKNGLFVIANLGICLANSLYPLFQQALLPPSVERPR